MRIVIPVDADDLEEAKITTIDEASFWLFLKWKAENLLMKSFMKHGKR